MKSKLIVIALAFALVFSLGCTNPAYNYQRTPELTAFIAGWPMLAFFALIISVLLVSLGYMMAFFLQDEPLKAKVRSEFFQVFYSALIILFAGMLATGIDGVALSIAQSDPNMGAICTLPNAGPCHIALARNFLDIIFKTAQAANLRILMINSLIATISSANIEFRGLADPVPIMNTSPFAGTSVISETLAIIFDVLIKLMMFIRFQEIFLDLAYQSLFPILFFTGIILRTFFFTRKLGGLLIALALGIYIVMPLMYSLSGYILFVSTGSTFNALLFNVSFNLSGTPTFGEDFSGDEVYDQNLVSATPIQVGSCINNGQVYVFSSNRTSAGPVPPVTLTNLQVGTVLYDIKDKVDPITIQIKGAYIGTEALNITATDGQNYTILHPDVNKPMRIYGQPVNSFSVLSWLGGVMQSLAWYFNYDWGSSLGSIVAGDALLGYGGLVDGAAMIMLFALFIPFVSVMVTIASIKVASPMLGGDVEIAGLTRLI